MNRAESLPRVPLALCAMLLLSAALVMFPRAAEPVLTPLRTVACWPMRALAAMQAFAAPASESPRAAEVALVRARQAQGATQALAERVAGAEPVVCRVLERRTPAAAQLPSLLVLDRSWLDLTGCAPLVTYGEQLIGVLGHADDLDDPRAKGLAVVRCLHHRPRRGAPQRVVAAVELDGGPLGAVVEPGSRIDTWPLRAVLLEDPYRAARLSGGGQTVRTTVRLGTSQLDLKLGVFRIWGYADPAQIGILPVGYHVELGFEPRALSTVVLWRAAASAASNSTVSPVRDLPARRARGVLLPGDERLFVTLAGRAEVGAAVFAGGELVGLVDDAGFGDAVVARVGKVGQRLALVLVPEDPQRAPIECSGRVVARAGDVLEFAMADALPDVPGEVLTGGNGLAAPSGLRVGRVLAVRDEGRRLAVERAGLDLQGLFVAVRPEAAP